MQHLRDESANIHEAMEEAFQIGRDAGGVPVVLSHHKVTGKDNWGQTHHTLRRFDEARRTQPLAIDVYPYEASSTVLKMDAARRSTKVVVTWSKAMPEAAGQTLASLATDHFGCSEEDAAAQLQPAGAIYWTMDEDDVRRVLCHECSMIGTDGLPNDDVPHPRLFGSFPRVLGKYCRDEGLFSLETICRKMSAIPAETFGLAGAAGGSSVGCGASGRGTLVVGNCADIVVFAPEHIGCDGATYEEPTRLANGVAFTIVNGEVVWRGGGGSGANERGATGLRPGRHLRRQALRAPMANWSPDVSRTALL